MPKSIVAEEDDKGRIRWFSEGGCVVEKAGRYEVVVGRLIVAAWDKDDTSLRNAIVVTLAAQPDIHLGKLARAFRLSPERLRQLRRAFEEGGVRAVTTPARVGRKPKVTARIRAKLEKMFDEGVSIDDAHRKMRRLGRSTIGHVHTAWKKKRDEAHSEDSATMEQATLPGFVKRAVGPRETEADSDAPLAAALTQGGFVQHAGVWVMLALLHDRGLHDAAMRVASDRACPPETARLAVDAIAAALSIGQSCVEGVRRIATPTAPTLLRASACPSPWTVRSVMRALSKDLGAVLLHVLMLRSHLAEGGGRRERGVYYVDNHLRPYTGKHAIRRGWRMQDKRVLPGITDYYVHDEDGRPLFRVDVPSHESLTQWLVPLAKTVSDAIGNDERVLVAFDRGGAFPEAMAGLRDGGFEFVTYERKPYPVVPADAFTDRVTIDGDVVRFAESRAHLGKQRGYVRRIAVLDPDSGRQINLLAVSDRRAARLIAIMRHRWRQENGFKHGVERWGINQLDRRKVEAYPPDTIIPNPARRRLDRESREAAIREGDARCRLAELDAGDARRARIDKELAEAMSARRALEAKRAQEPKRAALSATELAGKLVRHDGKVKLAIDTIRIACANVESDLAVSLAAYLARPREAKKALANLFTAPGRIRTNMHTISVDLAPASTQSEQSAFAKLLADVSRRNLTLPGDPQRRKLRFRCQIL